MIRFEISILYERFLHLHFQNRFHYFTLLRKIIFKKMYLDMI